VEVMMPSYAAEATVKRPPVSPAALFGLSPIDRECISNLVGHTLARIEREFILQTLRSHQGNITRTADRLGISIRSLRDKIRDYRCCGESVPKPANRPSQEAIRGSK
jgi:DNA-binding NtrC family response regulator